MGCCGSAFACEKSGKQLLSLLPGNVTEGVFVLGADDMDEAVEVMAASFAGTARTDPELGFDWCLGPQLRNEWDGPGFLKRLDLLRWYMKWSYLSCARSGVIFGMRNPQTTDLMAVICAVPPGQAEAVKLKWSCNCLCTMLKMKSPPPTEKKEHPYGPGVPARLAAQHHLMEQMQNIVAPMPHWYVWIMAVSPTAQGKGCCRKLMNLISSLADQEGVPCFLQTGGSRNVMVYSKLGYYSHSEHVAPIGTKMGFDKLVLDESTLEGLEPLRYVAMVRDPKRSQAESASLTTPLLKGK